MSKASGRVRLNIGGKIFETTTATLSNAGRNSMLGALINEERNLAACGDGAASEYFIDRNPECFSVLLDLLRSGELHLPSHLPKKLFYREALFFGLLDQVRAARCGPFDGDLLRLSSSVTGRAIGDPTAIRAAPDGGCCVAHGSVAHIYDWMLEEHRRINLDYRHVNDVGYVDADRIVITTGGEGTDYAAGGMGLFSSSSGELRHRFSVFHDNKTKTFTGNALCFSDSQSNIFASCRCRCNEHGIGVWDQNTGNQSDFFYDQRGFSLGDAKKLQWIEGDNFLMVASLPPRTSNDFIVILDFRQKNLVWSWTDKDRMPLSTKHSVMDAIVMDDKRSICVVNEDDQLGFLDMRRNWEMIRWMSGRRRAKTCEVEFRWMFGRGGKTAFWGGKRCYPKLVRNGGQLFCSMRNTISVLSGPEWVLTSALCRSAGDSICDISVGGDRLFALHDDQNVFDVWESPALPIL